MNVIGEYTLGDTVGQRASTQSNHSDSNKVWQKAVKSAHRQANFARADGRVGYARASGRRLITVPAGHEMIIYGRARPAPDNRPYQVLVEPPDAGCLPATVPVSPVAQALGMLCHGLSSSGHVQATDLSNQLHGTWTGILRAKSSPTLLQLASLTGLVSLTGTEAALIQMTEEVVESSEVQLQLNDTVKLLNQLVQHCPNVGVRSNTAWMLGYLYMAATSMAHSRSSVPSNYGYLPETSVLRPTVDFIIEAGRRGPEAIPTPYVKASLEALLSAAGATFPPVNWAAILAPLMRLSFGTDIQILCLKLVVSQASANMFNVVNVDYRDRYPDPVPEAGGTDIQILCLKLVVSQASANMFNVVDVDYRDRHPDPVPEAGGTDIQILCLKLVVSQASANMFNVVNVDYRDRYPDPVPEAGGTDIQILCLKLVVSQASANMFNVVDVDYRDRHPDPVPEAGGTDIQILCLKLVVSQASANMFNVVDVDYRDRHLDPVPEAGGTDIQILCLKLVVSQASANMFNVVNVDYRDRYPDPVPEAGGTDIQILCLTLVVSQASANMFDVVDVDYRDRHPDPVPDAGGTDIQILCLKLVVSQASANMFNVVNVDYRDRHPDPVPEAGGTDIQILCLKLVVSQASATPSAALLLASWVSQPLFGSLEVQCQSTLYSSLPTIMKSVTAAKFKAFLEDCALQTFVEEEPDPKLCQSVTNCLLAALKVPDPPQMATQLLYHTVEKVCKEIRLSSETHEVLSTISECLAELPDDLADKITQAHGQADLLKSCYLRGHLVSHGHVPMAWYNACINVAIETIEEIEGDEVVQHLTKSFYQCTRFKSRHTGDASRIQWLLEVMGQCRNIAYGKIPLLQAQSTGSALNKVTQFLVDVFCAAVTCWSCVSLPLLWGVTGTGCQTDTAEVSSESRILPYAILQLVSSEPWTHVVDKLVDWLMEMYQAPVDLPDKYKTALMGSVLALRHTTVFKKPSVWTRAYQMLSAVKL
ncbi:FOCAD [Branchiostoma lanceolatum]|uniref:FOCAD protein n=1 Tax=Branchiostoma lanceolatum TaxID=7740 RepID=A0A8J9YR57_BRALA|nr:FOCAD [Branchiostoma lanceolatum]